jgi:hypothetical protein
LNTLKYILFVALVCSENVTDQISRSLGALAQSLNAPIGFVKSDRVSASPTGRISAKFDTGDSCKRKKKFVEEIQI